MRKKKGSFILASASPRRRILLKMAGYRFRIVPSRAAETYKRELPPRHIVKTLALKKAIEVSRRFPDQVVLGADTIVFLKNQVIGKPRNKQHAVRMLKQLSGVWQKVYTGVAVVWAGGAQSRSGFAVSSVKMKPLTSREIERATRRHLDKAGSYAIQEKRDPFVDQIRGDYDNVVGLPIRVVRKLFKNLEGAC